MRCDRCKTRLNKTLIHHNQTHKEGQWETIGYWCKKCKNFRRIDFLGGSVCKKGSEKYNYEVNEK